MRGFLKFLCIVIVLAISAYVVYFLVNENNTYVLNKGLVEETEKVEVVPQKKVPMVQNNEPKEKTRSDIKMKDILVLSGDNNSNVVSLTSIRKSNIDNIIERNIDANGVSMLREENIPLEAYGPIIRDSEQSNNQEQKILSQNYIAGSIQVSGTMIYLMPDDEMQDRIQFHYAENGKLVAFVREVVVNGGLKTIVYFDENEMPFEQDFDTTDATKVFEEDYDDIYNRAKYAYNKYFNEEDM